MPPSFIDFDTQLLPDSITLPLLWAGLLLNLAGTFVDLGSAVIGAAAGYLALWSVYWLFKLVTGKEGMGFGDFKLLAAIGAWLGWQMLPLRHPGLSLCRRRRGGLADAVARDGRNVPPILFGLYLGRWLVVRRLCSGQVRQDFTLYLYQYLCSSHAR